MEPLMHVTHWAIIYPIEFNDTDHWSHLWYLCPGYCKLLFRQTAPYCAKIATLRISQSLNMLHHSSHLISGDRFHILMYHWGIYIVLLDRICPCFDIFQHIRPHLTWSRHSYMYCLGVFTNSSLGTRIILSVTTFINTVPKLHVSGLAWWGFSSKYT